MIYKDQPWKKMSHLVARPAIFGKDFYLSGEPIPPEFYVCVPKDRCIIHEIDNNKIFDASEAKCLPVLQHSSYNEFQGNIKGCPNQQHILENKTILNGYNVETYYVVLQDGVYFRREYRPYNESEAKRLFYSRRKGRDKRNAWTDENMGTLSSDS